MPLIVTGGFKTQHEATEAVSLGAVDVVGLAGAMALDPDTPTLWLQPNGSDPRCPRFVSPPPGGITAWFTVRLTAPANDETATFDSTLSQAIETYESVTPPAQRRGAGPSNLRRHRVAPVRMRARRVSASPSRVPPADGLAERPGDRS